MVDIGQVVSEPGYKYCEVRQDPGSSFGVLYRNVVTNSPLALAVRGSHHTFLSSSCTAIFGWGGTNPVLDLQDHLLVIGQILSIGLNYEQD
jgi:hypothetical protein